MLNAFVEASSNELGEYLWNDSKNWTTGVPPGLGQAVDIGDNPDVARATIRGVAEAGVVEVSEFDFNTPGGEGSSLNVESSGSLLCSGRPEGSVSIDFETIDGTAFAGSDFSASSGTLEWSDGAGVMAVDPGR